MYQNRIHKTLLAVVAGLLLINLGAMFSPPAYALGKSQYKAVNPGMETLFDANAIQGTLDQMSAQGWEYVGSSSMVMIFKK